MHVIELCAKPLCCMKRAKRFFIEAVDYDYPDVARIQKVIMAPEGYYDELGIPLENAVCVMIKATKKLPVLNCVTL